MNWFLNNKKCNNVIEFIILEECVVKNRLIAHIKTNDAKRRNEKWKNTSIGSNAVKLSLWLGLTKENFLSAALCSKKN